MKIIAILFLVCGVGLAGGAIYYASEHFRNMEAMMAQDEGPKTVRIVAAKQSLSYGDRLNYDRAKEMLRFIEWPAESVPEGAFRTSEELLGPERKQVRVVLKSIEPGELILKNKVTGFGEGLRLQVSAGMRAVTIPIDAVTGGGGHVSPGDRVDIQWTRRAGGTISSTILLWAVPVIALDQSHDTQSSGPRLGSTVTVEVSPKDAQVLRLALSGGTLALLLRGEEDIAATPSEQDPEEPELMDMNDLPGAPEAAPEPEPEPEVEVVPVYTPRLPTGKKAPGSE
ncbi:MAG: Flp pilus assembly protein CpaB [Pseudomonadota bacterium]